MRQRQISITLASTGLWVLEAIKNISSSAGAVPCFLFEVLGTIKTFVYNLCVVGLLPGRISWNWKWHIFTTSTINF